MAARMISILSASLLMLLACTPVGYVKPGVTDEVYQQDSLACAEIARHQAFRDQAIFGSNLRLGHPTHRHRHFSRFDHFEPSMSVLERQYRRVCMFSRGYELVPLDEESEAEAPVDP